MPTQGADVTEEALQALPESSGHPPVAEVGSESEGELESTVDIDIRVEEVDEDEDSDDLDVDYDRAVETLGLSRIEEVVEEESEEDVVGTADAESVPVPGLEGERDTQIEVEAIAEVQMQDLQVETAVFVQAAEKEVDNGQGEVKGGSRRSSKSENHTLVDEVRGPSLDADVPNSGQPERKMEVTTRLVEVVEVKRKEKGVEVVVDEVREDVDLDYVNQALAVVEAKSRIREMMGDERSEIQIHVRNPDKDNNTTGLELAPSSKVPPRKRKRLISAVFGRVLGKKNKTS